MRYVVSYDIEENRTRTKLAKLLCGYGVRVQYSVFECELNEKRLREMYEKVFELTENAEGSVRFYSICGKCEDKIVTIGKPINELKTLEVEIVVV